MSLSPTLFLSFVRYFVILFKFFLLSLSLSWFLSFSFILFFSFISVSVCSSFCIFCNYLFVIVLFIIVIFVVVILVIVILVIVIFVIVILVILPWKLLQAEEIVRVVRRGQQVCHDELVHLQSRRHQLLGEKLFFVIVCLEKKQKFSLSTFKLLCLWML